MSEPKPSALAELKIRATAFAHYLMKPPPESLDVRERCRRRTQLLLHSGRLIKQPCEKCGAEPVQAHHENYRRPDHVRWVCRHCHNAVHRRGAVLPAKLMPNPTGDDVCRFIVVLGLETVVSLPEKPPPRPPPKMVLTIPEAAAFAGLTAAYLRRLIKAGTLAALQDGTVWKIRRKDLEAL